MVLDCGSNNLCVVYKYIMLEGDFMEEAWKFVDLDCFEALEGLVVQRQRILLFVFDVCVLYMTWT